MLFIDHILLTVVVFVAFISSSIIIISKILEFVLAFLEVEFSKAIVVFEFLGVDFLLTHFVPFIVLFF